MNRNDPIVPRLERHGAPSTRRGVLGLAVAAAMLGAVAHASAAEDASGFIKELGDATLAVLRDTSLEQPQKLTKLRALLDQATDVDLIGRLVVGRYWKTATPEQQTQFTEAYRALAIKTLSERLSSYGGETFDVTGSKAVDERDTMVATKIIQTGGKPPLSVDWRVRKAEGRFLIIDIVAEGVSMIVSQRSEYSDIAGRDGFPALITQLRQRAGIKA